MSFSRRDQLAVGLGLAGTTSAIAGAWLGISFALAGQPVATDSVPDASAAGIGGAAPSAPAADLVVDIQGAVRHPGVVLLPPGARVADALEAAGGYSRAADLNTAAVALNLAATLTDGAQVYVPAKGVAVGPGGGGSGGGTGSGPGLVNLNSATPEELEALPGIGPVTVQKIVAARAEQPFATLDEMVERQVIDRGQLEDIRDLVTL